MEGGTAERIGDVVARTGDLDAAIGWYEVAQQERVVDSPHRLTRLAKAYAAAGRVEDADATFRKAISVVDEFPLSGCFVDYAAWLAEQNRNDEAEDVYSQLEEMELPEQSPYANFSAFLVRQGRTRDAISVLKRGIGVMQRAIADAADAQEVQLWRGDLHQLQAQLVGVLISVDDTGQAEQLLMDLATDIPYSHSQSQLLMDVLNGLDRPEDALVIARMAEFSQQLDFDPQRISQVDLQLTRMGRSREGRLRSLIRRAHGVVLSAGAYVELAGATSNLDERFELLREANRVHADSYLSRAALAMAERRRGNDQQATMSLWSAVELYEAEVQKLVHWSSLLPDAQPIDLFLRTFNAQSPREFLQACFFAVDGSDADALAKRLANALSEIGGDPAIVDQERNNVREFIRSKQQ